MDSTGANPDFMKSFDLNDPEVKQQFGKYRLSLDLKGAPELGPFVPFCTQRTSRIKNCGSRLGTGFVYLPFVRQGTFNVLAHEVILVNWVGYRIAFICSSDQLRACAFRVCQVFIALSTQSLALQDLS
jgi:hypothetical protein